MPDDDMPLHGYKEDFDGQFDDPDGWFIEDDDDGEDEDDQIREDKMRVG